MELLTAGEKNSLIELCMRKSVLSFGDFITKSGRPTQYFFNFGKLSDGSSLLSMAQFYAEALVRLKSQKVLAADCLYGPAYKGIPLVVSVSQLLAQKHQWDVSFMYNRKEKKDHGEGGIFVGADLKQMQSAEIVILEDVLTGGTSLSESMELLSKVEGYGRKFRVKAALVALNRMESYGGENPKKLSAQRALKERYDLEVFPLVTLEDIIHYLEKNENPEIQVDLNALKKTVLV